MLSENVFLQLMTDLKRFNGETLPCAPFGSGSDEEDTARAERLKGAGPVFIVHPSPRFRELNRTREGARD